MSNQDFTDNVYVSNSAAKPQMANVETNFEILRSSFSGGTAPPDLVAGNLWHDTSSGITGEQLLKVRYMSGTLPAGNNWLAVLCGDASSKVWFYRDTVCDGWRLDESATDRVLAIKGGSGLYASQGHGGETWANLKAHTHTIMHNHKWYTHNADDIADTLYDTDATTGVIGITSKTSAYHMAAVPGGSSVCLGDDYWTSVPANLAGSAQLNTGTQSTADVRPAAAIGTLQYPDI